MTSSSFLPFGKYVNYAGDTVHILDDDLYIHYEGEARRVLAVLPAEGNLECCPLCNSNIQKGAVVIVTDAHTVFPCWECDKLVEKMNDELREGYE